MKQKKSQSSKIFDGKYLTMTKKGVIYKYGKKRSLKGALANSVASRNYKNLKEALAKSVSGDNYGSQF